ncbi:hypothetical protein LCGC14_1712760, partial [marine sediment metagenome]
TLYGGIGGGGGEISLQGGRGRDAGNDPSSYAPVLLQSNGGNVGIGTTSPGRLFEIFGSASVFRFRDSGNTSSETTAYIEFGGTDGGNWNRTGWIGDGSSANTDLFFRAEESDLHLGDSSSAYVLALSGGDATFSGNVGIGNTDPNATLDVSGDIIANLFNGSWNGSDEYTKTSDLAYIGNCSVDQSCPNVIYTTDKLGNTTAEIRAQFGNSSNITFDSSTGSFFYNGTTGETDTTVNNTGYVNIGTINTSTDCINSSCIDDWSEVNASGGLWEVDGTEHQLITADEIDMQNQKIINLYTPPTLDGDAVSFLALQNAMKVPAGQDGYIQFRNGGAANIFGADSNLVWDNTNKKITITQPDGEANSMQDPLTLIGGTPRSEVFTAYSAGDIIITTGGGGSGFMGGGGHGGDVIITLGLGSAEGNPYPPNDGKLIVNGTMELSRNITMKSPDGSPWNCGVDNGGTFSCS